MGSRWPKSDLHRDGEQLDLRTSARDPTRDEEEFPKELWDAVPPIASCRVEFDQLS